MEEFLRTREWLSFTISSPIELEVIDYNTETEETVPGSEILMVRTVSKGKVSILKGTNKSFGPFSLCVVSETKVISDESTGTARVEVEGCTFRGKSCGQTSTSCS
nr:hypothetical protein MarFTME_024 [Marseillevirus futianmevirus]